MIRHIFRSAALLVLASVGVWAQSDSPSPPPPAGPTPFGSGEQPGIRYAGKSFPHNVLFLSLAQETAYDDNVLNNNAQRRADESFSLGARIGFQHERKQSSLALDYQPDLLLYREVPGYNVMNQGLQVDAKYQLHPRFGLRLRDSLQYHTGIFSPRSGEDLMPGLGSPTSLNDTVFTPLARLFENNVRLDAGYQKSYRTSLTFFGGFLTRDFLGRTAAQQGLRDTQGVQAGTQYSYRLSRSDTLGVLYLLGNMHVGDASRALIHTGFASYARQFSPSMRLDVFGGPQYARLHDRFTLTLPFLTLTGQLYRTRWHAALGGTFTRQSENTVLQISAQRIVTDSGGLLVGAVSNSEVAVNVRRRLARSWHANWNLGVANSKVLDSGIWSGEIQSRNSGIALEHSLTENLTARLRYNFVHQRSAGSMALANALDRNRVSFGISWQLRAIALGR